MNNYKKKNNNKIKSGSAFLIVIGLISAIIIFALFFSQTQVSRHFSTRYISDENKAEALAESAIELLLRIIKDKMNDPNDQNFYPYFRLPCIFKNHSTFGTSDGGRSDIQLDISPYSNPIEFNISPGPPPSEFQPLLSIINDLGGIECFPKLHLKLQIIDAYAFSAKKPDYNVTTISIKHAEAIGNSAKFLDDINSTPTSDGELHKLIGDLSFNFYLPNTQIDYSTYKAVPPIPFQDEHSIEVDAGIFSGLISAKVTLKKVSNSKIRAEIKVECPGKDIDTTIELDIEEKIKEYVNIGNRPFSLQSIFEMIFGNNIPASLIYNPTNFALAAKNRFDSLPPAIKNLISNNSFSPPQVIEKKGIMRLIAEVIYKPQKSQSSKFIHKVLHCDREFKVSDIHPVAPEYTFFVANSDKINEDFIMGLGNPIMWYEPSSPGIATIVFHNIPYKNYNTLTGLIGANAATSNNNQLHLPGMIRINSNNIMYINTFLGTKDEPTLSEINSLAKNQHVINPPFQLYPIFQWRDRSPTHKIHFPVLRHSDISFTPYVPTGVKSLLNIFSFCDALSAPTLLFGDGFFEFPLGIKAEAKLDKRYAEIKIKVHPKGQADDPKDITEVDIIYKNKTQKFGLPNFPSYESSTDWDPNDYKNMPANLYSTLQYAKKADNFYENESQFWSDSSRFENGVYKCDGVTYIKGSLDFSNSPITPFRVKGKGLLVVKGNILVDRNIIREGQLGETVFGLIARQGAVMIKGTCKRIEASVYSNSSLICPAGQGLVIDGNLVVNQFKRSDCQSLEVYYNGPACRISPLSVIRNVGKYEPQRYYVSLGKKWVRFEYLKNVQSN